MEIWDVYNLSREKIRTVQQGEDNLLNGEFHLIVSVCIFNSNGEMLIQQRQSFKSKWANLWNLTAGGGAISGETSQQAIRRELQEELGIDLDFTNVPPHFTVNYPKGFADVYLVNLDLDINNLKLQYEEVQNVRWANIDEILEKIDKKTFFPCHKSYIQLLFDSRNQYGVNT